MTFLDKIPDSEWFFCFPLSFGVILITLLGIMHPLFWIPVWRVYRSELFVFMYVLVGFWSFLSCALLYAIIAESSCLYVFWIWYTFVFATTMAGMMFLLFCGFCVLGMKRKSVGALLGLIYYLVTLYFVVVVNKQRKEVFGLRADCDTCVERRAFSLTPMLETTTRRATTRPLTEALRPLIKARAQPEAKTEASTKLTVTAKTTPMTTLSQFTTTTSPTTTTRMLQASYSLFIDAKLSDHDFDDTTRNWLRGPFRRDMTQESPRPPEPQEPPEPPSPPESPEDPEFPSPDVDRGLSAIARLSEKLIHGDECLEPRRPPHGRYLVSGSRESLQLTLRCNAGYRETSQTAQCRRNWWDRPLPRCRKKKPPAPMQMAGCVLPGYPKHGEYTVVEHAEARPGDRVSGDSVILAVTCDAPQRPVDHHVICVEGRWRHAPPKCSKHCKLDTDPTVEYKCLNAFKDELVPCLGWQPSGTLMVASCRRGHAHSGPFRYMRCRGDQWDHVVTCAPNANFTA